MLRSVLCNFSDAYIIFKGNITVNDTADDGDAVNNAKKVIFESCAPFIKYISKINNTQRDNAEYIDIVMPMYNLIEYSNNYSKISASLWQCCKEVPAINDNGDNENFDCTNESSLFKFKS